MVESPWVGNNKFLYVLRVETLKVTISTAEVLVEKLYISYFVLFNKVCSIKCRAPLSTISGYAVINLCKYSHVVIRVL